MQQQICEVVTPGFQTKELAIQAVRQPGQRVPVAAIGSAHRPAHGLPGEPILDMCVFSDVSGVVEADKIVAQGGEKRADDQQEEQSAEGRVRNPSRAGRGASRQPGGRGVRPTRKLLSGVGTVLL
jgi:hypothetical protein